MAYKLAAYLSVTVVFSSFNVWNWLYEPMGHDCQFNEPLPANNSGVKVLVYAFGKTGTTSMGFTLHRLNLNMWKGPEFKSRLWAPFADEYWRNPESGGGMFPWQRLATAGPPAYYPGTFKLLEMRKRQHPDHEALEKLPRLGERLAERLSRCRVEALAFDGHDLLFWPIYEASPDARVIMLNWRTWREWSRSGEKFGWRLRFYRISQGTLSMGMSVLPYNALVLPAWDALMGNRLLRTVSTGRSWKYEEHDTVALSTLNHGEFERRVIQHMNLVHTVHSQEDYNAFWEEGKRRIPKERLLEFNMKRNTVRDLCDFLQIESDLCDSGLLPNEQIIGRQQMKKPLRALAVIPYFFFCQWASWKATFSALGCLLGVVLAALFKLFPPKSKPKLA